MFISLVDVSLFEVVNVSDIKQSNVLELWASQYPEVATQWLPNLQIKDKSAFYFYRFCQWAHKTPGELLALKHDPTSKDAEKLLNQFAVADVPMTNAVKFLTVVAVRSFYKWNMCDLAKIAGRMELEKKKAYNKLSKDGLRRLWNYAYNPRDRALITFVCSTACAKETLSKIQWQHLEENWETVELPCVNLPASLIKGHGHGKYKNVRQITFLTPEAKRDLLTYRDWIEKQMNRKMASEDNIFRLTSAPYQPITDDSLGYLIWQLSDRADVPFSWHDGRRWVNTGLEQIGISQNWARVIRGRKCSGAESPYSRPAIEQLRAKFKEAVGLLEFTTVTATPTIPKEVADKLAALEQEQTELKRRYGIMRERTKGWRQVAKNRNVCKDSKNCQRIVEEAELAGLLATGWRFISSLPSGKILVSNEE
jgi:hypothetical protein